MSTSRKPPVAPFASEPAHVIPASRVCHVLYSFMSGSFFLLFRRRSAVYRVSPPPFYFVFHPTGHLFFSFFYFFFIRSITAKPGRAVVEDFYRLRMISRNGRKHVSLSPSPGHRFVPPRDYIYTAETWRLQFRDARVYGTMEETRRQQRLSQWQYYGEK